MPLGACEHKLAPLTKMRTSQRGCLPHHEQLAGAMNAPVCRAIIYMHFAAIGAECLLCASALWAGPALRMLVQELLGTASAAAWLSHSHPSSFNSGCIAGNLQIQLAVMSPSAQTGPALPIKMRASQRGCLPRHEQPGGAADAPVCFRDHSFTIYRPICSVLSYFEQRTLVTVGRST